MSVKKRYGQPRVDSYRWDRVVSHKTIELTPKSQSALQALLGEKRTASIVFLCGFIRQRLKHHCSTRFCLAGLQIGQLNASGAKELTHAYNLILRLITDRQSNVVQLVNEELPKEQREVKGAFSKEFIKVINSVAKAGDEPLPEVTDYQTIKFNQQQIIDGFKCFIDFDPKLTQTLQLGFSTHREHTIGQMVAA